MSASAIPWAVACHKILQARIWEWVAIPFSRGLPNPGNEAKSPALGADSLPFELSGKVKAHLYIS